MGRKKKKIARKHIVPKLYDTVGYDNSIFLLGVCKGTLYKWRIRAYRSDIHTRMPSVATTVLAALYLHLLEEKGWSPKRLENMMTQLNEKYEFEDTEKIPRF